MAPNRSVGHIGDKSPAQAQRAELVWYMGRVAPVEATQSELEQGLDANACRIIFGSTVSIGRLQLVEGRGGAGRGPMPPRVSVV